MLAAIRPESWNFPLFLHVVGAMLLVGGLLSGIASLGYGRGDARLLRLGFRALLAVAVPGWLLMRTGGAGIYSEEGWDALPEGIDDPAWLRVGALISDAGGLILLVALVTGGLGVYRLRIGKGAALLRATLLLSFVLLGAYVVAVWAWPGSQTSRGPDGGRSRLPDREARRRNAVQRARTVLAARVTPSRRRTRRRPRTASPTRGSRGR